jgi:hypothetical protein
MRSALTLLILFCSHAFASDWVVIDSTLSPDKKLSVAVFPHQADQASEADGTVLLVDALKKKAIGPLEEVTSTGGSWGKTTENVRCIWSADSTILIVNYRAGRLMHSAQIYRILNSRALPITLPDDNTHPKGKVLVGLGTTVNPGSEILLSKDGHIEKRSWGIVPNWGLDYSKHGLKGFEGELLFHYRFDEGGRLILQDITVPPIAR